MKTLWILAEEEGVYTKQTPFKHAKGEVSERSNWPSQMHDSERAAHWRVCAELVSAGSDLRKLRTTGREQGRW